MRTAWLDVIQMDFTETECTLMVVTSSGRLDYFIYVCGMG